MKKKPPPAGTNYFAINLTAGTQRVNTGTQIVNTGTQIVATSTQIAYFFSFPFTTTTPTPSAAPLHKPLPWSTYPRQFSRQAGRQESK